MKAFGICPEAEQAWIDLGHALRDTRTPCTGPGSDRWTSDNRKEREAAAALCGPCDAIAACAAFAAANKESDGVWGGKAL